MLRDVSRLVLGEPLSVTDSIARFTDLGEAQTRDFSDIMERICAASEGFAEEMVAAHMPVDRTLNEEREWPKPRLFDRFPASYLVHRLVTPVWVIVREEDLSGREMREATGERHARTYSMLSGAGYTYSSPVVVDVAKLDELSDRTDVTVSYSERAIGVNPLGQIVGLTKSFIADNKLPERPWAAKQYRVTHRPVKLNDIFNTHQPFYPDKIVERWGKRLVQATETYGTRRLAEGRGQQIERDPAYYSPEETFPEVPKRRCFSRSRI